MRNCGLRIDFGELSRAADCGLTAGPPAADLRLDAGRYRPSAIGLSPRFTNHESRTTNHARGMMLLEVILAIAILFVSMAVVGIQMNGAVQTAYESERLSQALLLAEAKLAQLDIGAIPLDREVEGDFGKSFPGYFWRFRFEPAEDYEEMFEIELEILYGTPEFDLEPGDIADAEVVTTLHTLRPTPPTLNLQRDFGFTDEQMAELAASLPAEILDPTEISPAAFGSMDAASLMALMPHLVQVFGAGFGFTPEQLQQAIESGLLDPTNIPTGADMGGLPDAFLPQEQPQ